MAQDKDDKTRQHSNVSTTGGNTPTQGNTAFIHKLYNMLEDDEMKEWIWWSPKNDSFLIKPNEKFSKGLSIYFKHTNIASFVRQLNMYGFHKVCDHKSVDRQDTDNNSDGVSETQVNLWEFKHSAGVFRKGDKESLKTIKRRSSRNPIMTRKNSTPSFIPVESKELWIESSQIPRPSSMDLPTSGYHQQGVYPSPDYFNIQKHCNNSQVRHRQQQLQSQSGLTPSGISHSQPHPSQQPHVIDSKVNDLSQSVFTLQTDQLGLQNKYDQAIEELKLINLDMLKLIDIVQRFISKPLASESDSLGNDKSKLDTKQLNTPSQNGITTDSLDNKISPGTESFDQKSDSFESIQQDVNKFKSNVILRLNKCTDIQKQSGSYNVINSGQLPLKQQSWGMKSNPSSASTLIALPGAPLPHNQSHTSTDASSKHHFPSNAPSLNKPSYPINQPNHDVYAAGFPPSVNHPYLMMNPFAKRKASSSKRRHMSVLMDPLAPASPDESTTPVDQYATQPIGTPYYYQPTSSRVSKHVPGQDIRYNSSKIEAKTSVSEKHPYSPISQETPINLPIKQAKTVSQNQSQVSNQFQNTQPMSLLYGQRRSAPNNVSYKSYFPHTTTFGQSRSVPGISQYNQSNIFLPIQHQQQTLVSGNQPRAASPLGQQPVVKPIPINASKAYPSTFQLQETDTNSSDLYTLLNHDSKKS